MIPIQPTPLHPTPLHPTPLHPTPRRPRLPDPTPSRQVRPHPGMRRGRTWPATSGGRAAVVAVAALSVLTAAGCATTGGTSLDRLQRAPAVEHRGHYTADSAGSWFVPCGAAATSAWWVTLVDTAVAQMARAREAGNLVAGRPSYVRWRGVRTEGGEVGPPGATALLVRAVAEVRPAAGGTAARGSGGGG